MGELGGLRAPWFLQVKREGRVKEGGSGAGEEEGRQGRGAGYLLVAGGCLGRSDEVLGGARGAQRRKGELGGNGFGNEAEEAARGSGARDSGRGARGPPSPDRARVLERDTRSRESGAALVGSGSIPRNEEAGRGGFGPWVRALVCGVDGFGSFGGGWLVRRGSRGGRMTVAAAEEDLMDGTARPRVSSEYIAVG